MCITCEHMLYEEHRAAEAGPFHPCPKCKRFPSNEGRKCYHCFSKGSHMDECPECNGKPWSDDFLRVKAEIEASMDETEDDLPETIH